MCRYRIFVEQLLALDSIDVDMACGKHDESAFFVAVNRRRVDVARLFIADGRMNPNFQDSSKVAPLIAAVCQVTNTPCLATSSIHLGLSYSLAKTMRALMGYASSRPPAFSLFG